jgi:hypothetical protein
MAHGCAYLENNMFLENSEYFFRFVDGDIYSEIKVLEHHGGKGWYLGHTVRNPAHFGGKEMPLNRHTTYIKTKEAALSVLKVVQKLQLVPAPYNL